MSDTPKPRIVRCPQCGNDSIFSPENPSRPFCSERCKLIDLGEWASESYRAPVHEVLTYIDMDSEQENANAGVESRRDSEDPRKKN